MPPNLHPSRSILEVERKFLTLAVPNLTQHGGGSGRPHFASLRALPTTTIHDTYFDRHDALSAAGAWVRCRNGAWQAKIRRGGDLTNSRFEEVEDVGAIAGHVARVLGRAEGRDFGLRVMADFVTTREAWVADGEFVIVRDWMDFGHEVGEVELQEVVEGSEEEKGRRMEEMDCRIGRFMERYAWAFVVGKPKGKLVAYFEKLQRESGTAFPRTREH
ncbi:CYTH-like domain-containing protein [Lasiosphaeria hispida]|uniref:CYTH-like domain-containing protein n=1 Tax=Lasiosphaeria hispida TaxID=260671 RepID=A0AAJ0HAH7_9PEZI|nr:CYTH-like domain-containing protein [Lasiosphaeria hispida]